MGAGQLVTPMAFTPTLWARLLKDGAIVEIQEPEADVPEDTPALEIDATRSAISYAKEHGIDLTGLVGSGADGRITLKDVKVVADA